MCRAKSPREAPWLRRLALSQWIIPTKDLPQGMLGVQSAHYCAFKPGKVGPGETRKQMIPLQIRVEEQDTKIGRFGGEAQVRAKAEIHYAICEAATPCIAPPSSGKKKDVLY